MRFFKKFFSSKRTNETEKQDVRLPDVYSDEYFKKRYKEENLYHDPTLIDGCMKMFKGFYIDNKLDPKVQEPINHPVNLDQIVNEGFGFRLYCKAFNLEDGMITMFLAMGFADFLINKYGFKLYKDSEPEFPLRSFTLKYDKNGGVMSLYPVEYAAKVLGNESSFENLSTRIDSQLEKIPNPQEVLEMYLAQIRERGK